MGLGTYSELVRKGKMRKQILALLLGVAVSSLLAQEQEKSFLDYFFLPIAYRAESTNLFNSSMKELSLVIQANNESGGITKGIVYSQIAGKPRIYLLIMGPVIFGEDGHVILDVSKAPGRFSYWNISVTKNQDSGKSNGIRLDWFADSGTRTTDPLLLHWIQKENKFKLSVVDPSEY